MFPRDGDFTLDMLDSTHVKFEQHVVTPAVTTVI